MSVHIRCESFACIINKTAFMKQRFKLGIWKKHQIIQNLWDISKFAVLFAFKKISVFLMPHQKKKKKG